LLNVRNTIQDECEKLTTNLSDATLFLPQLIKIDQHLRWLKDAEPWINVRNLDDSRICECLCYLIDLCLVISKYDLNLAQVKHVGQKALELTTLWRKIVTTKVINDGNDYGSEIQNILRD
jgi:hypothetical protein